MESSHVPAPRRYVERITMELLSSSAAHVHMSDAVKSIVSKIVVHKSIKTTYVKLRDVKTCMSFTVHAETVSTNIFETPPPHTQHNSDELKFGVSYLIHNSISLYAIQDRFCASCCTLGVSSQRVSTLLASCSTNPCLTSATSAAHVGGGEFQRVSLCVTVVRDVFVIVKSVDEEQEYPSELTVSWSVLTQIVAGSMELLFRRRHEHHLHTRSTFRLILNISMIRQNFHLST